MFVPFIATVVVCLLLLCWLWKFYLFEHLLSGYVFYLSCFTVVSHTDSSLCIK